jgi:hypothetical protein
MKEEYDHTPVTYTTAPRMSSRFAHQNEMALIQGACEGVITGLHVGLMCALCCVAPQRLLLLRIWHPGTLCVETRHPLSWHHLLCIPLCLWTCLHPLDTRLLAPHKKVTSLTSVM